MRRVPALAAFILITAALVGGGVALPAQAVDRPPSPGGSARWGQFIMDMKVSTNNSGAFSGDVYGGWSSPYATTTTTTYGAGRPVKPMGIKWAEPTRSSAGNELWLSVPKRDYLVDNRADNTTYPAVLGMGYWSDSGTVRSSVTCQATEWATTQRVINIVNSVNIDPNIAQSLSIVVPSDCRYIVSIYIVYRTTTVDGGAMHLITQTKQFSTTWLAERWYQKTPYNLVKPAEALCKAMRYDEAVLVESCKDQVELPLDKYCASPPSWDLWDGETYGEIIGFYADCLFHPRGTWDNNGHISQSWENGAGGTIGGGLEDVYEGYRFASVCGVVANGDLFGTPFAINTCPWTAWSLPIRDILGWGVWIGFGFWVLTFITRTVTGVIGARMPSPIEDEK